MKWKLFEGGPVSRELLYLPTGGLTLRSASEKVCLRQRLASGILKDQ
jgi:hypothetical protein